MKILQHDATGPVVTTMRPRVRITPQIVSEGAIGVTIVSPSYLHLAEQAVARFRASTGLDAVIIWSEAEPAFAAKLNLDLMVAPRPIVYFDVDLWLLRPAEELGELAASGRWCAVPDPCSVNMTCFCGKDTAREGWQPDSYFNSGLFACDLARPEIRRVFADARAQLDRVHHEKAALPADSTDQYFLNWAVQQQPGLLQRLGLHMNFFNVAVHYGNVTQIPVPVTGLHAAGVPLEQKLETLAEQARVFGPPQWGKGH
jgi:hypothetical protein